MWKAGDYIVCTANIDNQRYDVLRQNGCVKIREDHATTIRPVLDFEGDTRNGNDKFGFNDKHAWRYATPEEIAYYDLIGKPFITTDMPTPKETEYPIY